MSIFMNEKAQVYLAVLNGKVDDGDLNGPDFFSEVFKTNSPNHLSVYAGELTPKVHNQSKNNATAHEVMNKLSAETAMAAVKEKMVKENISPETLPQEMIEQIIADNIVENEIDKLVSELPPEVQTPMAEAFRTANKNHNRDRNRNRGRSHRE